MKMWPPVHSILLSVAGFLSITTKICADECDDASYVSTLTVGGTSTDYPSSIDVGADDSVVFGGGFTGSVDFDPGEGVDIHTSSFELDLFVSRYRADGSYQWTRSFGGDATNCLTDVGLDGTGSTWVVGDFHETIDLDPGEEIDERTSAGESDVYISKLEFEGAYAWGGTFGGVNHDDATSLALDNEGGVYVTGSFHGPSDLDPTVGLDVHDSQGECDDVFLVHLHADTSYGWGITFGGVDCDDGRELAIDESGNIWLCGTFRGVADFDPSDEVSEQTSAGESDIFLSKFDSKGQWQWTMTLGGMRSEGCEALAASDGGAVIAGTFSKTVDFDPTEGEDLRTAAGGGDMYVTRMVGDGTYGWTWTAGGTSRETALGLDVDGEDNVVVTGTFGVSGGPGGYVVDFDPGFTEDLHTSVGDEDVFVSLLHADGSYGWTKTFGGIEGDSGNDVADFSDGRFAVVGDFAEGVDFDPEGDGDEYVSQGALDAFWTTLTCVDLIPPCEGDVNEDGVVDPLDSGFVLSRFGCSVGEGGPECDAADANGDAVVDPLDAGYVLSRFGKCHG